MKLTLKDKKQETSDCISFIFQPEQPFLWKAGQFLQYSLEDPSADDRGIKRFFTIAAAPFEEHVRITTRFTPEKGSTFKKDLQEMQIGQTIEATGPNGSFTLEDPEKESVFIAGGIGITPFRAILLDLDHNQKPLNITLLYANRSQEIVYKDELEKLKERHPELKIHYIIDPQKIDAPTIQLHTSSLSHPTYYLSGPKPMVEAMEKVLAELKIPSEQIKTDYFPGYTS